MPGEPRARPVRPSGGDVGHTHEDAPSRHTRASLEQLTAKPVDLLIIGGGITGTGIARDAAMRGLRTVLVDQHDLGSGTSSRSSRLIHGGLRYLEHGDLRLVMEANRERRTLLRIAPHLVWPLPFVFPLHRGDRIAPWQLAAGMWLYDLLALFRNVRRHRMLGKRGVLGLEPNIRERGLVAGALYYDAQCDDARLVVATARSAIGHGALVGNYMAVRTLERVGGRVVGAHVEDRLTGKRALVSANTIVNATGAWADRIRLLEDSGAHPLLQATRGTHIAVDRARLGHTHAIIFTSPLDGRVMFVLPWGDQSYIGTTDTDTVDLPDAVSPSADDFIYLLRSANALFPSARLGVEDIRAAWSGLRPLVADRVAKAASSRSREHAVVRGAGGMLTVVGGKLTTYRPMAQDVVDRVVRELRQRDRTRQLGRPAPDAPQTNDEPLPGGEAIDLSPFRERGLDAGLPPATVDHLVRAYGTESVGIYNLGAADRRLLRPLAPPHPAIEAEVIHAVRRELAQTVEDVLLRRIHLFYERADHGVPAARRVAELMGQELGWSAAKVDEAAGQYLDLVRQTRAERRRLTSAATATE